MRGWADIASAKLHFHHRAIKRRLPRSIPQNAKKRFDAFVMSEQVWQKQQRPDTVLVINRSRAASPPTTQLGE